MRCSIYGQSKTDQIVRDIGLLTATVIIMLACADTTLADTSVAPAPLNNAAHLVAVRNDWNPSPDEWRSRSANGLQLTDSGRKDVKEVAKIEEITVTAKTQGKTALELEEMRLERMRESMYAELRLRERGAEEMAWWQADPDLEKPESLIKWGYSPQADYRLRRDNGVVQALSADHVQTASVIRIAF